MKGPQTRPLTIGPSVEGVRGHLDEFAYGIVRWDGFEPGCE